MINCNKVPFKDKGCHAIGGLIIFTIAYILLAMVTTQHTALYSAVGITLAVAIGKEVMDARDPEHHTADIWDAVATMALVIPLAIYLY